jgi:hypothetical protein
MLPFWLLSVEQGGGAAVGGGVVVLDAVAGTNTVVEVVVDGPRGREAVELGL